MELRALCSGLGVLVNYDGQDPVDVDHITHDSRKARHGSVFVAIEGQHRDGHGYIECATQLGAACVVTNHPEKVSFQIPILQVDNPRRAMALLARRLYDNPDQKLKVIGVTGTNGKTSVTFMVNHLLAPLGKAGRIGTLSYFNGIAEEKALRTTPESGEVYQLLGEMVVNGCRFAAIEISSHGLMLERVYGLELSYALFTNLSRDHLDFHGDMENYFQAKHRQFGMLNPGGTAIINGDDSFGRRVEVPTHARRVMYGRGENADLRFRLIQADIRGCRFEVTFQGQTVLIDLPLLGTHNVYNYLAALGVALCEGMSFEAAIERTKSLRGVPGRCEMIHLGQPFCVVVDFAHTPDALEKVLTACLETKPNRLILVFGAGGDRDKSKRQPMGEVAARLCDIVILTSDNPRNEDPEGIMDMVAEGIHRPDGAGFFRIGDRRQAIHKAIGLAEAGDLVLIAGKGHESTQEVKGQHFPFDDREVASRFIRQHPLGARHV